MYCTFEILFCQTGTCFLTNDRLHL
jgi:hypothetical protein